MKPGAGLMLLHPDGSEEVLVKGGNGSVIDPFPSLCVSCAAQNHLLEWFNKNGDGKFSMAEIPELARAVSDQLNGGKMPPRKGKRQSNCKRPKNDH
jgi:hypothetical protein